MNAAIRSASRPRRFGLLAELGLARPLAVGAVLMVTLALQSTVLTRVTLFGVIPQLLFVVVVCLAYLEGAKVGLVVGFMAGLLLDMQLPASIMGITALVYTLIGFTVGTLRQYAPSNSIWTPVVLVALTTWVAEGGYAILSIIMGERWVSIADTAKIASFVVLYNALLTPFAFPLIRKVADRYRPEKVGRI